jgi:cadmium resistance protein CadD (predicted permease)
VGAFIALIVPPLLVGLLGLIPIAIGIKRLVFDEDNNSEAATKNKKLQVGNAKSIIPFLTVSGITIANGGDEIGIFTPLFAKYNTIGDVNMLVAIFLFMTLVWCVLIYYFVNHYTIANRINYFGNKITPFVLIGIELYIFGDSLFF